jgi:hypothetical protein
MYYVKHLDLRLKLHHQLIVRPKYNATVIVGEEMIEQVHNYIKFTD